MQLREESLRRDTSAASVSLHVRSGPSLASAAVASLAWFRRPRTAGMSCSSQVGGTSRARGLTISASLPLRTSSSAAAASCDMQRRQRPACAKLSPVFRTMHPSQ